MRKSEKLVFLNISPKRFDVIRARAKAQGLNLDGEKGLHTWDGVGIDYAYDANRETLTITPTIPSFGVNANEVEGAISALVRQAQVPLSEAEELQLTRDERIARASDEQHAHEAEGKSEKEMQPA